MKTNTDITGRIGQGLWPDRRKYRVNQAIHSEDGCTIQITDGEAETLVRTEVADEIATRLNTNDPGRPKPVITPNYLPSAPGPNYNPPKGKYHDDDVNIQNGWHNETCNNCVHQNRCTIFSFCDEYNVCSQHERRK